MNDFLVAFLLPLLSSFVPGIHINTIALLFLLYSNNLNAYFFMIGCYLGFSIIPLIFFQINNNHGSLPAVIKNISKHPNETISSYLFGILIGSSLSILLPKELFSIYYFLRPYLPFLIITFSLIAIRKNLLLSLPFFFLFGLLGMIALNYDKNILFSIFTGSYALPFILFSTTKTEKKSFELKLTSSNITASILGTLLGSLGLLLPGISSPSVISSLFYGFMPSQSYITLTSAILSSQYILAIKNYLTTGKSRLGVIDYVKGKELYEWHTLFMLLGCLISITVVMFMLKKISMKNISTKLKLFIILYLAILSFYYSSWLGLAVLLLSFLLAMIGNRLNYAITCPLGSIIIPTLSFLL